MPKSKAPGAANGEPAAKKTNTGSAAGAWARVDSVYVRNYGTEPSKNIAGFDLDWTVIKTKSGKTFAVNKNDWELWAPEVAPKMQELHKAGRKVVIITNQGGVAKGKVELADVQSKLDAVQSALGVPLLAMVLTADDIYRKPLATPWKLFESSFNGGMAADKEASFYCGDAAGRIPPVVKKNDFSAGDLKFALNIGVRFQTPEECFLGKAQKYNTTFTFDPRKLGQKPAAFPVPALESQMLIICVGAPGSGKSSLAVQRFPKCTRVNLDTLKTKAKCMKTCEDAFKAGKSVIVDNQNKSRSDRVDYLSLAKKAKVDAIAILFDVPKELCFHLNTYRLLQTASKLHRAQKVPGMVIHSFYKNLQPPEATEGFKQVYRLGFEHFTVDETDADTTLLQGFLLG